MRYFSIQPTIRLAMAASVTLTLSMCKDSADDDSKGKDSSGPPTKGTKAEQSSPEQIAAEKIIKDHPNLEFVSVMGEKIHFQNVHTKLGLILPFQDVIDKKFESVAGGEAEAAKILRPLKSGEIAPKNTHKDSDWSKTPAWVVRYPKAKVQQGAIHTPRKDGSIWGQLSVTHSDPVEQIKTSLIAAYTESGMVLATDLPDGEMMILDFISPGGEENAHLEKRRVAYSLSRRGDVSYITMQYSYGMK